jgi:hypothetical protein
VQRCEQVPLAQAGVGEEEVRVTIYCVLSKVRPLLTATTSAVPSPDSNVPIRPPAAFTVGCWAEGCDVCLSACQLAHGRPCVVGSPKP